MSPGAEFRGRKKNVGFRAAKRAQMLVNEKYVHIDFEEITRSAPPILFFFIALVTEGRKCRFCYITVVAKTVRRGRADT
jgi:hypothetical protein